MILLGTNDGCGATVASTVAEVVPCPLAAIHQGRRVGGWAEAGCQVDGWRTEEVATVEVTAVEVTAV